MISLGQTAGSWATVAVAAPLPWRIAAIDRGDLSWREQNQAQAEIARLDREIETNPNDPVNYDNRGVIKDRLNDLRGALADYNRAIELAPNFSTAYLHRGSFKDHRLNFALGAFFDYNRAIEIDPSYAKAYLSRGILRCTKMNDVYIGIGDLRQAAQLARRANNNDLYQAATAQLNQWEANNNPQPVKKSELNLVSSSLPKIENPVIKVAESSTVATVVLPINRQTIVYYNTAWSAFSLGNKRQAIADYSRAIATNPNYADAYFNRGLAKSQLGDRKGATSDFTAAAKLYQQQYQIEQYQQTLKLIKNIKSRRNTPARKLASLA